MKKREAFDLLMNAKIEGQAIEGFHIDMLLEYFAPAIPAKPKTSFDWLRKFMATKQDVRIYLRFIYVEKGRMVASNGHALAWCDTDLEDGFYNPATGLKDESMKDWSFPEFDKVISRDKTPCTWLEDSVPQSNGTFYTTFKAESQPVHIKSALFVKAQSAGKITDLSILGNDGGIFGKTQFGSFIIMAFNLGE